MEATGERFLPDMRGQISYEHRHRYALAARLAKGKRVLDIASGEGYGSSLLSNVAASVIGVDIDPVASEHSRLKYANPRLSFRAGSCTDIPVEDNSVDLVTSFETIEHLAEHEKMMDEIGRVLVSDGLLAISSPNKLVYSDIPHYSNPYHVKELYFDEFIALLRSRFRNVAVLGQRITAVSAMHHLDADSSDFRIDWLTASRHGATQIAFSLPDPMYFMAICSNAALPEMPASIFADLDDDLLAWITGEVSARYEVALARAQQDSIASRASLADELGAATTRLVRAQEMTRAANDTILDLRAKLLQRETELKQLQYSLDDICNSPLWKVISPIEKILKPNKRGSGR